MLSEAVNSVGSGASSQLTSILAGPYGEFIFFGVALLILGIILALFYKFGNFSKG